MEQKPEGEIDPLSEEALHPTHTVHGSSDTQADDTSIGEREQLEEALHKSEQPFRLTFEATPAGIAHIGLDGKLLLVNQGFCNLVDYTREELYERTFLDITY